MNVPLLASSRLIGAILGSRRYRSDDCASTACTVSAYGCVNRPKKLSNRLLDNQNPIKTFPAQKATVSCCHV